MTLNESQPGIPRPEYPRPQFQRSAWINLNGPWTFAFDPGKSGMQRELQQSSGFDRQITVPFCPESILSGVCHTDFIEMMWYHRKLSIPAEWQDKHVILHFGGVDYECEIFIDGQSAGRHWGGTVSINFDITNWVTPGREHDLVVYVRDEVRSGVQPGGKQSRKFKSHGCDYTRTTGIWQTVWIEPVDPFGLQSIYIVPDLDGSRFIVTPTFYDVKAGHSLRVSLNEPGKAEPVSLETIPALSGSPVILTITDAKPWSPESPFLYDLDLEVLDEKGAVIDQVTSYAGLRKVHTEGSASHCASQSPRSSEGPYFGDPGEGGRVFLNNQPFFLRLVLDQGFYPDGIWTAPNDEALKHDIELSMRAGFNGARLHQKVFEERFHYWADRLGYLTWGESSSWGIDVKEVHSARNFITEWREIVCRDRNHPSIIAWTPFNETWDTGDLRQHNRLHIDAYELTRALDPTRPVNDASGYSHARTDLWTVHTYEQSPEKLFELLKPKDGMVWRNFPDREVDYEGQPYILDEFGGIKWIDPDRNPFADNSWGYGEGPRSLDEFYSRLAGLVKAIYNLEHIAGYCYTQLTDVEQEQNGIYNYDRTDKFDMDKISRIFTKGISE